MNGNVLIAISSRKVETFSVLIVVFGKWKVMVKRINNPHGVNRSRKPGVSKYYHDEMLKYGVRRKVDMKVSKED